MYFFFLVCTLNIPCVSGKKSLKIVNGLSEIVNLGNTEKRKKYRQAMVFKTLRIKLKIKQREKYRLIAWAQLEVIRWPHEHRDPMLIYVCCAQHAFNV